MYMGLLAYTCNSTSQSTTVKGRNFKIYNREVIIQIIQCIAAVHAQYVDCAYEQTAFLLGTIWHHNLVVYVHVGPKQLVKQHGSHELFLLN